MQGVEIAVKPFESEIITKTRLFSIYIISSSASNPIIGLPQCEDTIGVFAFHRYKYVSCGAYNWTPASLRLLQSSWNAEKLIHGSLFICEEWAIAKPDNTHDYTIPDVVCTDYKPRGEAIQYSAAAPWPLSISFTT